MNKKSKSKVVLGLAAILAATAGVAGVGTYAWFVTQNTAVVNFAHAHVTSDSANIDVVYRPIKNNGIAAGDVTAYGTAGFSIASTVQARDISGNGNTMYRPASWTGVQTTASGSGTTSVAPSGALAIQDNTDSVRYFVRFGINVTNKGAANTKVFIKSGSAITATGTGAADALSGARVAIWNCATDANHDMTGALPNTYWQQSATTNIYSGLKDGGTVGEYSYLKTAAHSAIYGLTEQPCVVSDAAADFGTAWHQGGWTDAAYAATGAQLLGNFGENESKYFTLTMWLDGTISSDASVGADIVLNMSLVALTH
jgi:hypothetical protein